MRTEISANHPNNNNNNNNNNNTFSITEIHQSGYRNCQEITINMVQNEC